ncbi:MAG: hypothetical protein Q8938_07900 [Bacteroidota bacterium]|nr:hypothetical protein [Bacteroidota bacterium]MDP4253910.1 hypothetical protein [Bacteroidota bacterium]MDP4257273.1 hypothetical protein [Bacteroidota bacterium]
MTIISLFLLYGCSPSRSARDNSTSEVSAWQARPLVIDGSDDDWTLPLPGYDKKEQVSYAMTNDKDNVYILLSARTREEQQKIIRGGMTVWINTQAEKSNADAIGIGFPTGAKMTREQNLMAQAQPERYQNRNRSVDDDLRAYTLYGFRRDETVQNFDSGQANNEGVALKIGFNKAGDLVYEASVPLSSIYPRNTTHNFAGKSLAIGIFIEGLPPNEGGGRRGGGSGVEFGGGVGMGTFGSGVGMGLSFSPGAMGGRGRGADRQLYQQTQIWHILPLARPGSH